MLVTIVNCNIDQDLTRMLGEIGRKVARAGTEISAVSPAWGVPAAEGFFDSFMSAASVLQLLAHWEGPLDAVVMAGFGEHGREGARQLLDVPVVDITEAAAMYACLLGTGFGVVTSVAPAVAQIRQSLKLAGLDSRCDGIATTEMGVLEFRQQPYQAADRVVSAAKSLIAGGADVIVLGCAAMAEILELVAARLPVPVIDGVRAAVSLCENLVHHRLATSKAGAYRSADPSRLFMFGWPGAVH